MLFVMIFVTRIVENENLNGRMTYTSEVIKTLTAFGIFLLFVLQRNIQIPVFSSYVVFENEEEVLLNNEVTPNLEVSFVAV
jgi:hypothetical protein